MTALRGAFFYHPLETACHHHRLYLPARFCRSGAVRLTVGRDVPRLDADYKSVILHGLHPDAVLAELVKWKVRGKRFVWSVDDDYGSIPEWNPCRPPLPHLEFYRTAAGLADAVVCSTEPLAATFGRPDVFVCPNLLDLSQYDAESPRNHSHVRVLWQGSPTHAEDLAVCEEAVLRVLADRRDVEFVFWGAAPPPKVYDRHAYDERLTVLEGVPMNKYYAKLRELRPDVVIAPLAACKFNESKSPLRVLEGWACGAAVVASGVGPYNLISHQRDGHLAATPDEFAFCLDAVVKSAPLRQVIAKAGNARVRREFAWQSAECRRPWHQLFEAIA